MKIALSDQHAIDLDRLLDTRLLIQANSGAGKSWALRRLLEQSHGRVQHLVIDPEGEFATLRERYDYVLAAPRGADTPAIPRSAALLAERLLELQASAILDIYELKAHERIQFVQRFLEALVDAPKRLWHPVLVVVDEAHVYCPQQGEAESAGAVIDLCTRGRKRGFAAVLATQRLSKLHKDAAAELNNKLIGRTGLDVDVRRCADELGFTKERWRELRELPAGHFFAFGPALSREVAAIHVGPVNTTHPKAGNRIAAPPPPPRDRVKALLPKLADLPAEAEERARSIDELKRDNAQLRRDLTLAKRASPAPPPAPAPKRVEIPVIKPAEIRRLEQIVAHLKLIPAQITVPLQSLAAEVEKLIAAGSPRPPRHEIQRPPLGIGHVLAAPRSSIESPARPANGDARATPASTPRRAAADGSTGLSCPAQRILDAIAWMESIGVDEPDQAAVAFLSGYSGPSNGAYKNPRGALRQEGLVRYVAGGGIALTDAGRAIARAEDAPASTEQLHARVLAKLAGPEKKILSQLIAAYPESLSNDELARAVGYTDGTNGAYKNPRGRLRSFGLIDYPTAGRVVARPVLFPGAS